MLLAQVDVGESVESSLTGVLEFLPKLLGFFLILIIGFIVARVLSGVLAKVLERVGFDRAVERGGVKKMMDQSQYDPSDILGKLVFYTIMLFVLQLAFGVFPENPISDLIAAVIAYLPRVFVAILILVIAAAVAAAVKEIVQASLGGLSYGKFLAMGASVAILGIGVFAALDQLEIAPNIVNGLFYAILALVVGSGIIAIGGGGIVPMRAQWEKALGKAESEAGAIKDEAQGSSDRIQARAQDLKGQAAPRSAGVQPVPPPATGT